MAGLLAARMLAHHKPIVIEAQKELPNNHSAVLRFRSPVVADALRIDFKKVSMVSDTLPWRGPVADALAYSHKNTGLYRSDRSVSRGLVMEERYIAPPDLVKTMANGVDIRYGENVNIGDLSEIANEGAAIISTIPMPRAMEALGYPEQPTFEHRHGSTMTGRIQNCDAYVSLLVPDPAYPFSRLSITGNRLIIELPLWRPVDISEDKQDQIVTEAATLLGISGDVTDYSAPRLSYYNKILPVDDEERKDFIWWATDKHNVYSLGRYATWRPKLLLDDLVRDVQMIEGWIKRRSHYDVTKSRR